MHTTYTSAILAFAAAAGSVAAAGPTSWYVNTLNPGVAISVTGLDNVNQPSNDATSIMDCQNQCAGMTNVGNSGHICSFAIYIQGSCYFFDSNDQQTAAVATADPTTGNPVPLPNGSTLLLALGLTNTLPDQPTAICDLSLGDQAILTGPDSQGFDDLQCQCGTGRAWPVAAAGTVGTQIACVQNAAVVPPPSSTSTTSTTTTTTTPAAPTTTAAAPTTTSAVNNAAPAGASMRARRRRVGRGSALTFEA